MEYRVQRGDTIAQIKSMMNIEWDRLRELNPKAVGRASNGNWFLKEGAEITDGKPFEAVLKQAQEPAKPDPVQESPLKSNEYIEHTIKPGDTLWALAVKKYHVNMDDVIRDNNIKNPDLIQPGQKIRIRTPEFPEEQVVTASWYGESYHGRQMADGKLYNMYANTIAHKDLPFGTKVELENPETGVAVEATVTDRGPFIEGRDVDLSYSLAKELSLVEPGVGKLKMRIL